MYNERLRKRYAVGKRNNSFYMDMPRVEGYEKRMEILSELSGYTYHIDRSSNRLVQENI